MCTEVRRHDEREIEEIVCLLELVREKNILRNRKLLTRFIVDDVDIEYVDVV